MSDKQDSIRLNLDDYDFKGLTSDVLELADMPSAVATVAKRALLFPLVVGIVVFLVFNARTSAFVAIFVALVSMVLSLGAGVLVGVWRLTRQRGEALISATDRVVTTLGDVHKDLGDLPIGQTKGALSGLTADYMKSGAIEEAAVGFVPGLLQPLAKPFAKRVVWGPKRVIERSTLAIIDELPTEVLEKSLDEGGALDKVADVWQGARDRVQGTVNKVMTVSLIPVLLGVVMALVPLLIWVGLMWWAT